MWDDSAGSKQVVNGVLYDLHLAVAITPCRNPHTLANADLAEPAGHPCEKDYRVANTQPLHARVLAQPSKEAPFIVTFDDDIF